MAKKDYDAGYSRRKRQQDYQMGVLKAEKEFAMTDEEKKERQDKQDEEKKERQDKQDAKNKENWKYGCGCSLAVIVFVVLCGSC